MESAKIHFNVIFSKIDDLTERTSIELSQSQGRAMLCPEGTESLPKPGINPTRWARHMKTPETLFGYWQNRHKRLRHKGITEYSDVVAWY